MADSALIVFAKAPIPGLAKTRLVPTLGKEGAARLAARMLRETLRQAVDAGVGGVELCCTPDTSHPALREAAEEFAVVLTAQCEGDLGRRMQHALGRVLSTHRKALLIGTDAPALDRLQLRRAACLLNSHSAVFVPAIDGGYVLVGLAQPIPALFERIDWSTERVMAQTRDRLSAASHVWAEMPALPDIDLPADRRHVPKEWLE